ncbi:hypothetical protein [Pseudoalteromonas sp.]|uniref:hypothetical protein n=1 Tax=Pseudoalteromonas sp. TaxID=53249 RepID=UPI0030026DB0
MTLPVTMYRWDDDGAPQVVDGKPSEYMNVLKKCLVEGYGTKTGLGWSVEDEIASPPLLTLRNDNNVGSGGYAVFSANNDNARENIRVEGCQDYVNRDNRGRRSSYFEFYSYSTGINLNSKWFLIGTGKAFYLFLTCEGAYNVNYTGTRPAASFFMGDFNSLYPNDPATFISLSGSINSQQTSYTTTLHYKISDSSTERLTIVHPLDGSDSPYDASLISLGDRLYVAGRHSDASSITVFSPIYLLMGDGNLDVSSNYQNQTIPYSRGLLPGAMLANSPGYNSDPMPVIKVIDNIQYYLIPSGSSHTGCVWINLEQW